MTLAGQRHVPWHWMHELIIDALRSCWLLQRRTTENLKKKWHVVTECWLGHNQYNHKFGGVTVLKVSHQYKYEMIVWWVTMLFRAVCWFLHSVLICEVLMIVTFELADFFALFLYCLCWNIMHSALGTVSVPGYRLTSSRTTDTTWGLFTL
jgi:hypothetical protein